jgi:hypothetical protein
MERLESQLPESIDREDLQAHHHRSPFLPAESLKSFAVRVLYKKVFSVVGMKYLRFEAMVPSYSWLW